MDEISPNGERIAAPSLPDTPLSRASVLASLSGKLSAMGVGLARSAARIDGPPPLCWAHGFRGLHQRPFVAGPLKLLDRIRRRQLSRFRRKPISYGDRNQPGSSGGVSPRDRRRGSYVGQFRNQGGENLIRNSYRAGWWERNVMERFYHFVKWHEAASKVQPRSLWNHVVVDFGIKNLMWFWLKF